MVLSSVLSSPASRGLGAVAIIAVLLGASPLAAPVKAPPSATTFRLGAAPVALATAGNAAWVVVETRTGAAQLWRLDARTGRRLRSVVIGPAGPDIGAISVTATRVWAAAGDHVISLDQAGRVRRIQVPGTVTSLAVGLGSVWAVSVGSQHVILRLDPERLTVRARIATLGGAAAAVAAGSVWVAGGGELTRLNPYDDRLTRVLATADGLAGLAVSPQRAWLLEGRTALALDRAGRVRRRLRLPFAAASISVANGRLWAIDNCGCAIGRVAELDLRTGRRIAGRAVGETPVAVAAGRDRAWVAGFGDSTLMSIRAG
jgi:hypothetical protein